MGSTPRYSVKKAEIDNLTYTLAGVMHSVDKWLDGPELEMDEVNRAICMREKLLRILEEKAEHNPLEHPEWYLDDTMAIVDDMTMAQRKELLKYLEDKIEGNRKE